MALFFDESEFEKLLIMKGEEYGEPVVVEVELEAYKRGGLLEYLFYVYQFGLTLKENHIPYVIRFDDYPSWIIDILGLDSPLTSNGIQKGCYYPIDQKNQFDIHIPFGMEKEIIFLFSKIANVQVCETRSTNDSCILLVNQKHFIRLIKQPILDSISKFSDIEREKD